MSRHVLILGGTGEALALARSLAEQRPDLAVTTSLAGVTETPVQPPGRVRSGGFGGAAGLAAWLGDEAVDLLVDATHPFAATMARHAAEAAALAGVPRLKLVRAMWPQRHGDRWIMVPDAAAAARALADLGARRVFLTLGVRDLDAFAGMTGTAFTLRMIAPPPEPLPLADAVLLLARGPFDGAAEEALMREHRFDALVTKASGGAATQGKIDAARVLGLPVVMIARPPLPPGERAADVAGALAWIGERLAA